MHALLGDKCPDAKSWIRVVGTTTITTCILSGIYHIAYSNQYERMYYVAYTKANPLWKMRLIIGLAKATSELRMVIVVCCAKVFWKGKMRRTGVIFTSVGATRGQRVVACSCCSSSFIRVLYRVVLFMFLCYVVCMAVYRSSLCDHGHGKGQHQLGQGERTFDGVLLFRPREKTWLATHHWLSCCHPCSETLRFDLRNCK